jgi:hypothetical protein
MRPRSSEFLAQKIQPEREQAGYDAWFASAEEAQRAIGWRTAF